MTTPSLNDQWNAYCRDVWKAQRAPPPPEPPPAPSCDLCVALRWLLFYIAVTTLLAAAWTT